MASAIMALLAVRNSGQLPPNIEDVPLQFPSGFQVRTGWCNGSRPVSGRCS